jgi:hypothetical protein
VAGGSTPLAFLLGGIGCLALAFVVIGFTRRMATAGYAYTYASRSLGTSAGFMAGWLYFFGFICFVPMTMSAVGYLAADLLGVNPKLWILFFFIGMVLFVVLSTIKIKVTTRVQLIVGIVTIAVILVVDLVTTAKGGINGQALSAFTFQHTNSGGFNGVFYGIIFGVTSYIGFETAADFGEETANPRRNIPIAVIVATLFAIVLYLWTTYSITIGFGVNNGKAMGSDPVALKTTATTYVGSFTGTLVEIGGMLAAFIVCVACATAAARTLFAMGREGVLPAALGRTHPTQRRRTSATAARTWPRARCASGAVRSWVGSMSRNAISIAANEATLTPKQGVTPTIAMIAPASAGPTIRAACTMTLLSETALTTRSGPTISMAKLCRVGLSTAFTEPRTKTSAQTIHGATAPLTVMPQRTRAGTAIRICVTISSLRLGRRSARRPPKAPKRRNGRNWRADVTPTASPLPVSDRISHISATICIQLPVRETSWPVK